MVQPASNATNPSSPTSLKVTSPLPKTREITSTSPTRATTTQQHENAKNANASKDIDPNACAGCGEQLKEGQALIAIDRQWHIWCFRYVDMKFSAILFL